MQIHALRALAAVVALAAGADGVTAMSSATPHRSTPNPDALLGRLALSPAKAHAATLSLQRLSTAAAAQTMSFAFQTRDKCSQTWTPVQSAPDWFVIGNCEPGTFFHVAQRQNNPDGRNFDGGQIFGDFGGNCGWIQTTRLTQYDNYAPANPCVSGRNPNTADSSFIYQGAGCTAQDPAHENSLSDWCIWTDASGQDGVPMRTVDTYFGNGCPEYANFFPWSSTPYPANLIGYVPVNDGSGHPGVVYVRYLVRLPDSAYGSGYWFMVQDHTKGSGLGNWAFIPASCFQ